MHSTLFLVLAYIGIAIEALLLLLAFFDPGLEYRISDLPECPPDSDEFLRILSVLSDAQVHRDTKVEVLTNGDSFYEAELEAIRTARRNVNLEAYIFQKGEIASRFITALAERARAGVKVSVVLDAVGSFNTWKSTFRELIEAGGRVCWYVPFRWNHIPRYNNRTHRELLVADGEVAFLGGAGVGDHWYKTRHKHPKWRDTMFRVEGRAVASLQALFAENWLEACGELLTGSDYYPECKAHGRTVALVVDSSPTTGGATRARMLYQVLLASATRSIHITTPYFLPDRSARRELVKAIVERGVEVKILVPGKNSDHLLTRTSSRRIYGELLRHGAQIYEYLPSMIHTKALVVDGIWTVVGSTNFDYRSFGINDEVNLAALDDGLAARVEADFQHDLARSRRVTYSKWRHRSPLERAHEWLGWLTERQQ